MILKADEKHMAVERRPVLFGEMQLGFRIAQRFGMLAASGHEIVVIEDAVVFIRDQFPDDGHVLCGGHLHQILRRVMQSPAVVHVNVHTAAVPALSSHMTHAREIERQTRDLVRSNGYLTCCRPVFKAFHRFDPHRTGGGPKRGSA